MKFIRIIFASIMGGILMTRLFGSSDEPSDFLSTITKESGIYELPVPVRIPVTILDTRTEDPEIVSHEDINIVRSENNGSQVTIFFGKNDVATRATFLHVPVCPNTPILQALSTTKQCLAVLGNPHCKPYGQPAYKWGFFSIRGSTLEIVHAVYWFSESGEIVRVVVERGEADVSKINGIRKIALR